MKIVITEYELDQIIRMHITNTISNFSLSEDNSEIDIIQYGVKARIDEIHVTISV